MASPGTQDVATQQMTFHQDSESESSDEETGGAWGKLFPENASFDTLTLSEPSYTFGRHATCDFTFEDPVISNRHCTIAREKPLGCSQEDDSDLAVFLTDTSSNGTYVNNERVGKGNRIALKHGNIVSLTQKKQAAPSYVFHDCMHENNEPTKEDSPIKKKYNFTKQLGSGACGEVWLAVEKRTGHKYAIKVIKKGRFNSTGSQPSSATLKQEVEIMAALDHPCVVQVVDYHDSPEALYIVLELAQGGEFFDRIVQKRKFSEEQTRYYFFQLFFAVQYLHSHDVAHRDLKPENVLLASKDDYALLKLTDFGLAKLVGPQSFMKTMCGTPTYQAPEVLQAGMSTGPALEGYSAAVDMWSLGVMLYICLCGFPPFGEDIKWHDFPLSEQILKGIYSFPEPYWDGISEPAKDLVRRLLTVDPKVRYTVDQALEHEFMKDADTRQRVEKLLDEQQTKRVRLAAVRTTSVTGKRPPPTEKQQPQTKRPR
eukprot:m.83313 g.83313  ORF g.83313 m.83313 type:complete len:484 (+) comp14762_c0_seq2:55-1506(+)